MTMKRAIQLWTLLSAIVLFFGFRSSARRITAVAGGGGPESFCGDGGPATSACLYLPHGVAVDPISGSMLIADTFNHRVRLVF